MTEKALLIITDLVPRSEIQILPLSLFDSITKLPVNGYHLVNNLLLFPALAYEAGDRLIYSHQIVVKDSIVAPNAHLFRLTQVPHHWIVSEELWQRLSKLDGYDAIAIATVP